MIYNIYMSYKSSKNIVYSNKYHVVWCPKYRRKVLIGNIRERLIEVIKEVSNSIDMDVIELEVMPDHVHVLIEVNPQFGIHKAVKRLKGISSRVLRKEFKELTTRLPTLWSNSYFLSTIGGAPLKAIKKYIESQKE